MERTLRKWGIFVFILIGVMIFFGCNSKTVEEQTEISGAIDEIEQGEEGNESIAEEEPEIIVSGIPSPLSGLVAPEEKVQRRPLVIIFDNYPSARPQAGLIDAEIAYEFLAEGGITRYMGVFLINEPEVIGGIRSARPYLVQKALEFDGYLVHVGGSDQALHEISSYKVADIDAMSRGSDVFWRIKHKKAPHNMYCSYQSLKKAAEKSKFRSTVTREIGFQFYPTILEISGKEANEIHIHYHKDSQPSYKFDQEEKIYRRYYHGKPHVDEVSQRQLTCTNIIIQEVSAKVIDAELRLHMDTIGEGRGYYITNGKVMDIRWKKDRYENPTKYYDMNGRELILNPGQTWIQVVKNLNTVTISE